jgi:hypothetical protein
MDVGGQHTILDMNPAPAQKHFLIAQCCAKDDIWFIAVYLFNVRHLQRKLKLFNVGCM